jgi:three-Cys-motif partner protein
MPYIDLHKSKPFDESTQTKLSIFEQYAKSWLITFLMQNWVKEISIVDFFSGPGYDLEFKKGSPILLLETIEYHFKSLDNSDKKINLYLNEFITEKYINLQKNCNEFLSNHSHLNPYVRIDFYNNDFNDIFDLIISRTSNNPSLYILDQNGIKFLNETNFKKLLPLNKTDFMFFISSSYFNRFAEDPAFKLHLDIDCEKIKSNPYKFIHRTVLDKYKSLIPMDSELKIFPFSIKKGANIHGIIFGSKHILGVQKFLDIAWKENGINGQANYDIDDDLKKNQLLLNLFNEEPKLSKVESFKNNLENFIMLNKKVSNKEIYYFTCEQGHIRKHADEKLKELRSLGKIDFSGHPKISWVAVKNNEIVEFIWR